MSDPVTPAAPASGAAAPAAGASDASILDPSRTPGDGGGKAPNAAAEGKTPDASAQDPAASKPGDDKKPADKPAGAPEKYSDFKLPEGVTLDSDAAAAFTAEAKKLNLTQEAAQSLIDLQAKVALDNQNKEIAQAAQVKKDWEAQVKKDLGNEYDKEMSLAAKARDKFVPKPLMDFLNESGLGSHPEMVKLFAKLGKAIAEDDFVEGKPGSTEPTEKKSTAAVLFGGTSPKK